MKEQCANCLTCSQFTLHVFTHLFHFWIALCTSCLCQCNDDVTGFNQCFPGARPLQAVMQNLISLPIAISLRYFLLTALRNNALLLQFTNNNLSIHIFKELITIQVKNVFSWKDMRTQAFIKICFCTQTPWVRQLKQVCLFCKIQ